MTTTFRFGPRRGLPVSWLIALVTSVAVLATLIVFEADLARTNRSLKDGVDQIGHVVIVNDLSVDAARTVGPSRAALGRTQPPLAAISGSLQTTISALRDLNNQLDRLAPLLGKADAPLAAVVATTADANRSVGQATDAVAHLAALVARADQLTASLASSLDQTATSASRIDAKLRTLRLFDALSPVLTLLRSLESLLPALSAR